MKLKKLLQENQEGCSFRKDIIRNEYSLVSFKRGYFVALTDNRINKATKHDINRIDKLAYSLRLKRFFYGYWRDNNSIDVLDLSLHVMSKKASIELCKTFKQQAYFDCKKQDSVYI